MCRLICWSIFSFCVERECLICQEYTYIKMAQIEKIVCIEKKDYVLGCVGAGRRHSPNLGLASNRSLVLDTISSLFGDRVSKFCCFSILCSTFWQVIVSWIRRPAIYRLIELGLTICAYLNAFKCSLALLIWTSIFWELSSDFYQIRYDTEAKMKMKTIFGQTWSHGNGHQNGP